MAKSYTGSLNLEKYIINWAYSCIMSSVAISKAPLEVKMQL